MSKELDALERGIIEFEKYLEDDCNNEWLKRVVAGMKKCYQRLEAIDNANPSEALKGLKHIKKYYIPQPCLARTYDYLEIIEQALLKAQEQEQENAELKSRIQDLEKDLEEQRELAKHYLEEQEKVLEIIKEKPLSLIVFKLYKTYDKDGLVELNYQSFVDCQKEITEDLLEELKEPVATEQEFDLLKRYFGNENI